MGFPLLGVSVLKSAVFMQLVTMVCLLVVWSFQGSFQAVKGEN